KEREHEAAVSMFGGAGPKLTHSYILTELVALAIARGLSRAGVLSFVRSLLATAVNILVIARNPGKTAIFLSLTTVRLIPSWIVSRPRSSRNRGKTARNRVFSLRL